MLAVGALLGACVQSSTKQCGDFTCSESSVCSPSGDRCVLQSQLDACRGMSDGTGCSIPGISAGVCLAEVCIAAGCGNGILETAADEVCDDGNLISGDGCRADCKSQEMCGDGVTDFGVGEGCDCGSDANDLPFGCTHVNSMDANAECRPNCSPGRCGDGILDVGEICDDGNNKPGDGCRADCAGRWTRMASPTLSSLSGVWAASPTDAWVTGGNRVLRWNGVQWNDVTVTAAPSTELFNGGVFGLAADDVFVVGTFTGHVYRFHANAWTDVTPPNVSGISNWQHIAGNATSVWLGGGNSNNGGQGAVAPWNGNAFTIYTGIGEVQDPVQAIWVSNDGFVYVVDSTTFVIRRNLDGSWTNTSRSATNVGGNTSTDYIVLEKTQQKVFFTNGSSYTLVNEPIIGQAVASTADASMVVGNDSAILVCHNPTCKSEPTDAVAHLQGVFMLSATRAFIVGANGTILY